MMSYLLRHVLLKQKICKNAHVLLEVATICKNIAYRGRPPTTLSSITERNQIYFYKKKQRDFWQACLWLPVALETVKSLVPLQTKTSAHLVDKERTERIFKLTSSNLMAKKKLCC